MWSLNVGGVILLNLVLLIGSTSQSLDDSELDYTYYDYMFSYPPFKVPGVPVADLHASQFLEALGRAWDVNPIIDGLVMMCDEVSPHLNRPGLKGIVRAICDPIRNSDVEKSCRFIWDLAIPNYLKQGQTFALLHHSCYPRSENYGKVSFVFEEIPFSYEQYPLIREVKHLFDTVFNFTLYDVCSESGRGLGKTNNIIFSLMEWFGPWVYFPLVRYDFNPIATCSISRNILSMETTDFIEQSIEIWKYPIADVLEYFGTADVCHGRSDNIGLELLKDLLAEFSDLNEDEFCEEVSGKRTRNEYLERAVSILENMLSLFRDNGRCDHVMSILAPLDEDHVHVKYVGFNLSVPSQRRDFCQQVVAAFSPTSSFVPSPYRFPSDVDLNEWQPFKIPGEFLPGISFVELLNMEGAAFRSGTIIEGWSVYCVVFEEFLFQIVGDETFDTASICDFIKNGNTEGVEDACVTLLMYEGQDESYRYGAIEYEYSVFPFLFYTVGELTGVKTINKEETCHAAENLLNSDMSLKNVIEVYVEVYLRELIIPAANRYCHHWEEAVCYLKPYCYLSVPPNDKYSRFYEPPSTEEIAARQANFDKKFSSMISLMLTMFGFDERNSFCSAVEDDIDPASGRAVGGLTERLRSELIKSFTIVSRCSQFIDTVLGLFSPDSYTFPDGNILHQLSGFRSSYAFCKFFSDVVLQTETATTSHPGSTATESKE